MFKINFVQPEKTGLKKRWLFIVMIALWSGVMMNYFVAHGRRSRYPPVEMDWQELRLQGVLIRGQTRWALLFEQGRGIKRVKVGDRLSQGAIVVKKIMPEFVELSSAQGRKFKINFS